MSYLKGVIYYTSIEDVQCEDNLNVVAVLTVNYYPCLDHTQPGLYQP